MTEIDPILVAVKVAGILEDLSIPHLICGSVASTLHGEPRTTMDVDFAIHLRREQAEPLVEALQADFYVDSDSVREAANSGGLFNVIHLKPQLKVDLYVRPRDGIYAEEIARAQRIRLGSGPPEVWVRVATAEDTVLQKLRWYNEGGRCSERQWRDVLGVLKAGEKGLDESYLWRWANELELRDLLESALSQARSD